MPKHPREKFPPPMFLSAPNRQRKICYSPIKQHFFENPFHSDRNGRGRKLCSSMMIDHIKTVFDFLKYLVLMVVQLYI